MVVDVWRANWVVMRQLNVKYEQSTFIWSETRPNDHRTEAVLNIEQ